LEAYRILRLSPYKLCDAKYIVNWIDNEKEFVKWCVNLIIYRFTYKDEMWGCYDMDIEWSRSNGFKQMKIEYQNNNVPACKFYHKQGAVLILL